MTNVTRTFCLGRGVWYNLNYQDGALVHVQEHDMRAGGIVTPADGETLEGLFIRLVDARCAHEEAIIDKANVFLLSDERMVDVYRADLDNSYFTYTPGVPLIEKRAMHGNRVLDADSYKLSHSGVYPNFVTGMFSYGEARTKNDAIVFFGLQMWLMKTWLTPLTRGEIDEAEKFAAAHGEPFDRAPWDKIIDVYDGKLPVTIRALPEGTVVRSGIPLYSVECTDPDLFWLSAYIETSMQRGVWYPTTIASNDYKNYRTCKMYLNESADTLDLLPFMLHDFGGRGVSSEETAQIGGAAHLVYFMGSDTISGVRAANWYYDSPMSAYSVAASEHSVQTAFGKLNQLAYLNRMLDRYAKPGAIVSMVIDGYDTFREAGVLCSPSMVEKIKASGARVVFRPDSGDPREIIPRLLEMQAAAFGTTRNSKGYKVINNVGIIQGDGIDHEMMEELLKIVTDMGYSAQNIVFGSGGGLLQKVNRDTYKFAQKASAIQVSGRDWKGISKDPITDPGKKSKSGRVTATRWKMTGELGWADLDQPLSDEFEDIFQTVFKDGELLIRTNLEEVRARARA